MNLTLKLQDLLRRTLEDLEFPVVSLAMETPPAANLGDRSSTVALILAKQLKREPEDIAKQILEALPKHHSLIKKTEVAGRGYLNFHFSKNALIEMLKSTLDLGSEFGGSDFGGGEKRLFEYVSANPTGPMNVVSARAAALGQLPGNGPQDAGGAGSPAGDDTGDGRPASANAGHSRRLPEPSRPRGSRRFGPPAGPPGRRSR